MTSMKVNRVSILTVSLLASSLDKTATKNEGFFALFAIKPPKGGIIIKKSPDKECVSEGIGFAGLILAENNDKASQTKFWDVYKGRQQYFTKSNGVMAWKTDLNGNVIGKESASDGDQDFIAAMITVYNKLKSGKWALPKGMALEQLNTQIKKDLDSFWKAHIKESGGKLIYLATDGKWAQRNDGKDVYYSSYPDPYFLKLFGDYTKDNKWGKLINDVQELNRIILNNSQKLGASGQNPMPAKVFVKVSGKSFVVENYYSISKKEGVSGDALKDNEADSIRFFLRQARYAIACNDNTAKQLLKDVLLKTPDFSINDPSSVHLYAGQGNSKWGYSNILAKASYGIAVYAAYGKDKAKPFVNSVENSNKGNYYGDWEGAKDYYYDQAIISQIMNLIK